MGPECGRRGQDVGLWHEGALQVRQRGQTALTHRCSSARPPSPRPASASTAARRASSGASSPAGCCSASARSTSSSCVEQTRRPTDARRAWPSRARSANGGIRRAEQPRLQADVADQDRQRGRARRRHQGERPRLLHADTRSGTRRRRPGPQSTSVSAASRHRQTPLTPPRIRGADPRAAPDARRPTTEPS